MSHKILIFMLVGILLSCKPDSIDSPSPIPATNQPHPSLTTLIVRNTDSSVLNEVDPPEDFDRIPISVIDKALSDYDSGDTLSIDSVDANECIGIPLNRYKMANGLLLEGNTYNIYATTWNFSGEFNPVFGLHKGMKRGEILAKLGRPAKISTDTLEYLSDKPDGYEKSYFDSRWTITLKFDSDSLRAIVFKPWFDDC